MPLWPSVKRRSLTSALVRCVNTPCYPTLSPIGKRGHSEQISHIADHHCHVCELYEQIVSFGWSDASGRP